MDDQTPFYYKFKMRFRGLGLYSNIEREKNGGEREKSLVKTWGRPLAEEKDIEEEEFVRR